MNLNQIATLVVNEISAALTALSAKGIQAEKVDAEVDMTEGAEYTTSLVFSITKKEALP